MWGLFYFFVSSWIWNKAQQLGHKVCVKVCEKVWKLGKKYIMKKTCSYTHIFDAKLFNFPPHEFGVVAAAFKFAASFHT